MQDILVISEKENIILTVDDEIVAVVENENPLVVAVGIQGPSGPAGPAGSSIVSYTAGENLGGHKLVILNSMEKALYASGNNISHVNKIIGVTTGAAAVNTQAEIQTYGQLYEPSWNWDVSKPLFAGINGVLTQSLPASGFIQQVATVISPVKIFINIQPAIIIA